MNTQGRKILFISLSRTGSTAYASEMARQMKAYNPIILCSDVSKGEFDHVDQSIPTYSGTFSFLVQSILFFFRCPHLIDNYRAAIDHLIIYFPVFHPWNLIISLWAGIKKIPIISTIHDYETHVGEKNRVIEFIQKRQMEVSDKIVFLSDSERRKAIISKPKSASKSVVLPHPLLNSEANHQLTHTKDLRYLFLGRLQEYKGYQMLVESAKNENIKHITIAGIGTIKNLHSNKIHLINKHLSKEEIKTLIESHHVLVMPYIDASQSGVVMLALDASMPLIISRLDGLQEQLKADVALWVEPNLDSLKNAMIRLQNDPSLYNSLKKNLKTYKTEYHTHWTSQLHGFMQTILA